MNPHYQNEEDIRAVVDGFERCTTAKEAFTHREHLTVATWYVINSANPEDAIKHMRNGLLNFLSHHGVGSTKYKEKLTQDWMKLVRETVEKLCPGRPLLEVTNNVLDQLSDSRLVDSQQSE